MDKSRLKDNFIAKAKNIHKGENLDYSEVEYINNRTPVKIIDHDVRPDGTEYGEFWQTPSNHLKGQSHPDKKRLNIAKSKLLTQDEVIRRFKEVHRGEKLDYSEVKYQGMHTKVKIISHELRPDGTEYGEFWQEPVVHLKGCTHPDISRREQSEKQRYTTASFIEKAKKVHCNKKYNYGKVNYVSSQTKVTVICEECNDKGIKHGEFRICPDALLQGKGCPKCGKQTSEGEDDIVNFIKERSDLVILRRERGILNGKELDIYLPQKCIAFEYNGLRWHSEQFGKDRFYHIAKTEECASKGVKLFHIFEDEYLYHREVLFAKISRILGFDKSLPKIGARKCVVKKIDNKDAECFLNLNHIQGYCKSSIHLGAFYDNKLISVMSFTKYPNDEWCLERFASDIHYIVQGICSKIVKYFVGNYRCKELKTFLDRRWERSQLDNVYTKCGFTQDSILKPDYRYTDGHGKRLHKFNFRKQKLHKKYGFPLTMTESEMVQSLGYHKIWDCGLIKYIYVNNKNKEE